MEVARYQVRTDKNRMSGITFKNPDNAVFCPKHNFLPKIWDVDGSVSGIPGFIMNSIGKDERDGIDPLIDDGTCVYIDTSSSNNAPIIKCGPASKSAFKYFTAEKPGQEDEVIVKRKDNGAGRSIDRYFDTKFAFFARPDVTYQVNYNGESKCFKGLIRDGIVGEVYQFEFVGKSGKKTYNFKSIR